MSVVIHPTAHIDESAGPVELGEGVTVGHFAVLVGPLCIGSDTHIYAGCVLGLAGGHREIESDWKKPILIGSGSVLRERVSVLRGLKDGRGTTVGPDSYLMSGSHVDHDCFLGAGVTLSMQSVLAGSVTVGDYATLGVHAAVHQGVCVGAYSMVGMGAVCIRDVPPGHTVAGVPAEVIGLNRRGLQKHGIDPERFLP